MKINVVEKKSRFAVNEKHGIQNRKLERGQVKSGIPLKSRRKSGL
jgi:hypothetical protein